MKLNHFWLFLRYYLEETKRKESEFDANVPDLTDFTTLNVAALTDDRRKPTEESEYELEDDATEEIA